VLTDPVIVYAALEISGFVNLEGIRGHRQLCDNCCQDKNNSYRET